MGHGLFSVCLALAAFDLRAQGTNSATFSTATNLPAPAPYKIVDVGANHRNWQQEIYAAGPHGQVVTNLHRYTELGTGMYYQKNGKWTESREVIRAFPGGAVAEEGAYQVIFGNDLNSEGAIDVHTQDGKRLRSNILGLEYYDTATGNSVLIGKIQNSQGELISSNQVLYANAFTGVAADVRYTYRRGSFEQDVILREQPPTPESLGLHSETTELEVVTEFLNPPEARVAEHRNARNRLPDQEISWGGTWIGQGKAFDLSAAKSAKAAARVKVRRQYATVQGRHILTESVPLAKIGTHLESLPPHAGKTSKLPKLASKLPVLPQTPLARVQVQPMKLAAAATPNQGYVLDYIELNSDQDNMVFQGDTTYYISSGLNLNGVTTFEGGAVIKFSDALQGEIYGYDPYSGSGTAVLTLNSSVVCETTPYRPVIFTSMDDNTVGDGISGSTGSPATLYVTYLDMGQGSSDVFENFRFCYANLAVLGANFNSPVFQDCQFVNCNIGFGGYGGLSVFFKNCLLAGGTGIEDSESGDGFVLENVTMNNANYNLDIPEVDSTLYQSWKVPGNPGTYLGITNTLFAGGQTLSSLETTVAADGGTVNVANNADVSSSAFQTVGGGSYYLAAGSPYHNAGTGNLDPALLADLATKTTYPPVVYSDQVISSATTLGPQALRDNSGTPDLGYHYDPLDYVIGGVDLTANLTFTAGTALGWYEYYGSTYFSQPYGIAINDNGNLNFNGTATQPCHVAVYNLVQEGNGNWTTYGWMAGFVLNGSGNVAIPELNANFTKWSSTLAYNPLRDNWDYGIGNMDNCELYNCGLALYASSYQFTNCLLWRCWHTFNNYQPISATYLNCTYYNGALSLNRTADQPSAYWAIVNCAFDGTAFLTGDGLNGNPSSTHIDYNAYNSANTSWQNFNSEWGLTSVGTLATIGAHDLTTITSYGWESSWFGNFYLPAGSPLVNAGSTTANNLGLYHFTTQTSQLPEGNSVVDIGYHYVATDANGNPLDANCDGIPDYLEDANGNGVVDNGESPWEPLVANPISTTVTYGSDIILAAAVEGACSTVHYQWQQIVGGVAQNVGSDSPTFTISKPPVSASGAVYDVILTSGPWTVTSFPATITILPAPLRITANDQLKPYGTTQAPTVTGSTAFTVPSLPYGETVGSVTLTYGNGGLPAPAAAGSTSTITPSLAAGGTFSPLNYSITYRPGTLTVRPVPLTITANGQSKTYGQALTLGAGSTQFTATGLQNNETVGSVTLASSGAAGNAAVSGSPYSITPSAATGGTFTPGNYAITYNNGSLAVTPAALSITARAQSKTYGQVLAFGSGNTQFTASGLQNGETVGSVTLACSGGVGTAGVSGASYTITPSAATGGTFAPANYTITYTSGSLTVTPAALGITASGQSKTYGQALTFGGGSTQFTASGLQNGETVGSVTLACNGGAATTAVSGSPYTITPSAATGGTYTPANYTITYNPGSLTVSPAALSITANGQSKTYGQALTFGSGSTLFTVAGLQNGETVGSVTLACSGGAATASASGSPYAITPSAATGGTFAAGNYTITYNAGTLTVGKAALNITANGQSKAYGQVLTFGGGSTLFTASGLQNGETVGSVTLASGGGAGTAPVSGSPYAITPSAATGGTFVSANYNITYNNGSLTVTPAALSITASGQSKAYGTLLTFGPGSALFTASGLQNGDTVGSVTLACSGGAVTVGAGSYPITPSQVVGGNFSAANYSITYVNGTLTVTKAPLTVAATPNQIMGYGQAVPGLTYTISGFLNGDTASVVSGAPVLTTTATASSPTGSYPITVALGTLSAANYAFTTFVNGSLSVESVVSIAATAPTASEVGLVSATYTVSRTDHGAQLVVNLQSPAGTAVAADYTALPGSVTIPANANSVMVTLTPTANFNTGVGSSTVVLSLATGTYVTGTASATCTIIDDYNSTTGDGLADAMCAEFGCSPLTANTGWDTDDSAGDGLPQTYQALVGAADIPAPGLPNYNLCPLP